MNSLDFGFYSCECGTSQFEDSEWESCQYFSPNQDIIFCLCNRCRGFGYMAEYRWGKCSHVIPINVYDNEYSFQDYEDVVKATTYYDAKWEYGKEFTLYECYTCRLFYVEGKETETV